MDNNMDLNEMKRLAALQAKRNQIEDDSTPVVGSNWADTLTETVSVSTTPAIVASVQGVDTSVLSNVVPKPVEEEPVVDSASYSGPGLVIENKADNKPTHDPNVYGVLNPETMANVNKYMAELDEEIERIKEAEANKESNTSQEDVYDNPTDGEKEFMAKYNTASEVIVKTGVGSIVNFTPEEREKLERARTIKLEEVETREIKTLKTKKVKKPDDLNKIIKRVTDSRTTSVVLPLSGYTVTLRGCSGYELMTLMDTKGNAVIDTQNKWSVIHSKIESTSIGKMDFNTFLHNTAAADYNNLLYGIICATYPDDDTIPVTCPNEGCKTTYNHHYSIRSLIRAEEMSDKLRDEFMKIADASVNKAEARKCHEESSLNIMKTIVLPASEYVAEIYIQSAHDLINRSIKGLNEDKDNKYAEASILSTMVNRMLIPDVDEDDGSYFEIDAPMQIGEIIYNLPGSDLNILRAVADDMFGDMIMSFGLMNVKCPNCGHFTPTIPMELENLLFHKYRREMNMSVE